MSTPVLEKLQVLVTGVDAEIARDVVRMVVSEGASVTAADKDTAKLARLDRDVGLYRTQVGRKAIDLASAGDLTAWQEPLRRSMLDKAVSVLRRSTLRGVLGRNAAGGITPASLGARASQPATRLRPLPLKTPAPPRADAA